MMSFRLASFSRLSRCGPAFYKQSLRISGRYFQTYQKQPLQTEERLWKRSSIRTTSILLALAVAGYSVWNPVASDDSKNLDASASVSVDISVSPFPTDIYEPLSREFSLVGYGTRAVTFLSLKVYALGIYIAKEDIRKIAKVFDSASLSKESITKTDTIVSHHDNVISALKDPETSRVLISNLLDAGVKFTVRIVPVRNTDFNHLRDGLVKSVLAHPQAKQFPELNDGLTELRKAFDRKGSVPKNHCLLIETLDNGVLQIRYQKMDTKTNTVLENVTLGKVENPIISKLLLLQYMSGKKPLSENTRQNTIEKLALLS